MKLSVIIPAYNEKETIREIVARVQAVPIEKEIVIVDDGSTDGTSVITRDVFSRAKITTRLLENFPNRGKGAAVREGVRRSRGESVLVTDADLSTPIEESRRLFAAGAPIA